LRGFNGMTNKPVTRQELTDAREPIITDIVGKMPDAHRTFLIGFERGEPNWNLLGLPAAGNCRPSNDGSSIWISCLPTSGLCRLANLRIPLALNLQ
jgi:hypothetical protein